MQDITFKTEKGKIDKGDIKVFALSTCAFCKKALKFLKDHSISFCYVYVDELDIDTKQKIKNELKEKFKRDVGFPFIVLNGTTAKVGFTEEEYQKLLL